MTTTTSAVRSAARAGAVLMAAAAGLVATSLPAGAAGTASMVVSATQPKTNPDFLDVHNKNPSLRSRRVIGALLLEGFTGGPTEWSGGHVYNPGDGNTYSGKLTLIDDNHLKLTGCALWVLCKSQMWTRLE